MKTKIIKEYKCPECKSLADITIQTLATKDAYVSCSICKWSGHYQQLILEDTKYYSQSDLDQLQKELIDKLDEHLEYDYAYDIVDRAETHSLVNFIFDKFKRDV